MSDPSQQGVGVPDDEPRNGDIKQKMRTEEDELENDDFDLEMAELEVEAEQARLLVEQQQRELRDKRSIRQQALAEKRREIEALKQQLHDNNVAHSPSNTSKPSSAAAKQSVLTGNFTLN